MAKGVTLHNDRQREWEREAEGRVVPWEGVRRGDYDFRGWAREEGLALAGCVYEWVRESWKLRCLLALVDSCLSEVQGMEFLGLSYKGLRYRDAVHELGGWFGWLRSFADELARNVSFGELESCKLEGSLEMLREYFVGRSAVGFALGGVEGVLPRVREPGEILKSVVRRWGTQEIAMEIRLGEFTDEEIGEEMAKLAGLLRGGVVSEPERRGKGKEGEMHSLLDALSAVRLAAHYPKTMLGGEGSAVSKFNDIRLGGIRPGSVRRKILGVVGHNEFDRYAARGRRQFQSMFRFGESAANAATFTQRQR